MNPFGESFGYQPNTIKSLFESLFILGEKYGFNSITQIIYDIFNEYKFDDIKKLIKLFQSCVYEEEVIINCLKLLQYGLSIKELIIIIDYIKQIQTYKRDSKIQDNQQKPDFLNYCDDLKSIFFNPDELPKLNEILYYVCFYRLTSKSIDNKICIKLMPYIETKYFNDIKKENWFFIDGKIINDNSKTNIILNHYCNNIFKIYYEFDDKFIVFDDNEIRIDYNEIQKLNNYKIKIKFSLVDFASSFITEFMAFKYSLPHEYIIYNDEITHDKCDNIIMKKIIDYNKSKVFGNIELYGYFENNNGIELGDIYLQSRYYNGKSGDIKCFISDNDWKCFEFDTFIKSVSDIVVRPKPKKLEKSEDDEETLSDFSSDDFNDD